VWLGADKAGCKQVATGGEGMFDDFNYRRYRVHADVREVKVDRRMKWYGVVTVVHDRNAQALSFEDRLFDWPGAARRYAVQRVRELIDAYVAGDLSALDASPSSARSRPAPEYPPGAFGDTVTHL